MYNPSFRTTKKNVPILSKNEIDLHGERFILDFCPEALKKPMEIDAEEFIEFYLRLKMDYQFLSNDGRFLGMMIFNDTNKVIIYDPEKNKAEYIHTDARTVIIDNTLLAENQEHRRRFTIMHEGGHDVYHSTYYYYDPNQLSIFDLDDCSAMVQCRSNLNETLSRTNPKNWTDEERMEWQANAFASAILMPKQSVSILAADYKNSITEPVPLILETSKVFNVSKEAAMYRLQQLKFIPNTMDYQSNKAYMDLYSLLD